MVTLQEIQQDGQPFFDRKIEVTDEHAAAILALEASMGVTCWKRVEETDTDATTTNGSKGKRTKQL